jgi:hypothetical protein
LTLSGPVGWLVGAGGMLVGGFAGNKVYNSVFPDDRLDGIALASQIDTAQRAGIEIQPEDVFRALVANLPDRISRKIEKRLQKAGDDPVQLSRVMQEFDPHVRKYAKVDFDPADPLKTVAEQFAERINGGRMTAKDLLDPVSYQLNEVYNDAQQMANSPLPNSATSGVRPIARNMAGIGVAMAGDDAAQMPLPFGNQGPAREV